MDPIELQNRLLMLEQKVFLMNRTTNNSNVVNNNNIFVGTFTASSTGIKSITWLWFTPQEIRIQTTHTAGSDGAWSDSTSTGSGTVCMYNAIDTSDLNYTGTSSNVVDIYRNGTSLIQASFISLDADWFTINFGTMEWSTHSKYNFIAR